MYLYRNIIPKSYTWSLFWSSSLFGASTFISPFIFNLIPIYFIGVGFFIHPSFLMTLIIHVLLLVKLIGQVWAINLQGFGWHLISLNWFGPSLDSFVAITIRCRCGAECIVHACRGITQPKLQAFDHTLFSVAEEHRHNQRNVGLDPGSGSSSLCPQSVRSCSAELCKHPDQDAFLCRWIARHWWRRQRWTTLGNVNSLSGFFFPCWLNYTLSCFCIMLVKEREVKTSIILFPSKM